MHDKFEVKWTKYYVNDIECKRDGIYQTILDNKLYDVKIILTKKYHFESSEKNRIEKWNGWRDYKMNTSNKSENQLAYISLDTRRFQIKWGIQVQNIIN